MLKVCLISAEIQLQIKRKEFILKVGESSISTPKTSSDGLTFGDQLRPQHATCTDGAIVHLIIRQTISEDGIQEDKIGLQAIYFHATHVKTE